MSTFDFTTPVRAPDSLRWAKYAGTDTLALWVADMDFAAPPAVIEALQARIANGVFGYGQPWPSLVDSVVEHCAREYGWTIDPDWLVWLPGLVSGLHVACRAVGETGDGVFTATPVYPPFLSAPVESGRRLVTMPLVKDESGWGWDFAAANLAMQSARLFLLCHPHNPVGRAWREDELWQLAALAEKHDLVVCSDEIHCDLTLSGHHGGRHRPFATLSPEIAARTITLMAPSKTFNIAGLGCAFAVIPDAALRRRFLAALHGIVPHVNVLGLAACEAAYRHGGEWRRQLLDVLKANAARVERGIEALPALTMTRVEAGFLAWIDCRELGLEHPAAWFERAGVGLSEGSAFGPGTAYARFVRLNFGTPRALLDTALERMTRAVETFL